MDDQPIPTLTREQAELFRRLRPRVKVLNDVSDLMVEVLTACPHQDDNDPNCPVCTLYAALREGVEAVQGVPGFIDAALDRSPPPRMFRANAPKGWDHGGD